MKRSRPFSIVCRHQHADHLGHHYGPGRSLGLRSPAESLRYTNNMGPESDAVPEIEERRQFERRHDLRNHEPTTNRHIKQIISMDIGVERENECSTSCEASLLDAGRRWRHGRRSANARRDVRLSVATRRKQEATGFGQFPLAGRYVDDKGKPLSDVPGALRRFSHDADRPQGRHRTEGNPPAAGRVRHFAYADRRPRGADPRREAVTVQAQAAAARGLTPGPATGASPVTAMGRSIQGRGGNFLQHNAGQQPPDGGFGQTAQYRKQHLQLRRASAAIRLARPCWSRFRASFTFTIRPRQPARTRGRTWQ